MDHWHLVTIYNSFNTAVGYESLLNDSTGDKNTAVGYQSGNLITTGVDNTIIGYAADVNSIAANNQIVIGSGAVGAENNTAVIGNTLVYEVKTGGGPYNLASVITGTGAPSIEPSITPNFIGQLYVNTVIPKLPI